MSLFTCPTSFLLFLFLLLPLPPCQPESHRGSPSSSPALPSVPPYTFAPPSSNGTGAALAYNGTAACEEVATCSPGILLPVWKPDQPGLGYQVARAVVYFASLMYMFLGVSIIADRFMASIEVITSQVRRC